MDSPELDSAWEQQENVHLLSCEFPRPSLCKKKQTQKQIKAVLASYTDNSICSSAASTAADKWKQIQMGKVAQQAQHALCKMGKSIMSASM